MIDHVMRFNARRRAGEDGGAGARLRRRQHARRISSTGSAALKARIGIPAKLGAKGVNVRAPAALVDIAVDDICHQTNPKPVTRADFEAIFRQAI